MVCPHTRFPSLIQTFGYEIIVFHARGFGRAHRARTMRAGVLLGTFGRSNVVRSRKYWQSSSRAARLVELNNLLAEQRFSGLYGV